MHTVALCHLRTAVDGAGRYVRALARLRPTDEAGFVLRASAWRPDPTVPRLSGPARGEIAERIAQLEAEAGQRLGTPGGLELAVDALPHQRGGPQAADGVPGRTTVRTADQLHAALERFAALAASHTVVVIRAAPPAGRRAILVTRDPANGAPEAHGMTSASRAVPIPLVPRLRDDPRLLRELERIAAGAETVCRDVCRIDVAIHADRVTVLGVRPAVRTAEAGLRIAVDLVDLGLTSVGEALDGVPANLLGQLPAGGDRAAADLARVLAWADERRLLPIVAPGVDRRRALSDADQLDGSTRPVVVLPRPGDIERQLHDFAVAAERDRISRLALLVNRALRDADLLRLPAGPWDCLIGPPDDPGARVLAARLLRPQRAGSSLLDVQLV